MAPEAISFQFQHPTFRLRHRSAIRAWIHACAAQEGAQIGSLRFLFCDDGHMLVANRQFLDHDYLTDILTFPDRSAQGIAGDILISVDRTRDNANTLSINPLDELHRVIAHGVLHLIGFDDHTPSDKSTMRSKEDFWLTQRRF